MDWTSLAASYRRQLWLERHALRCLLDMLAVGPRESVLDVATGTGALLEDLARRPGRPATAVGIDAAPEMLALAPPLPAGWRLERANATALPHPDASFDVVTAAYLLHVLESAARAAALAEIVRVLRPGGRIGTVTIAPPRGRLAKAISAPVRLAAERSDGRLAGLRPLDPARELAAAGLHEAGRMWSFRGYPSLCVVAVGA